MPLYVRVLSLRPSLRLHMVSKRRLRVVRLRFSNRLCRLGNRRCSKSRRLLGLGCILSLRPISTPRGRWGTRSLARGARAVWLCARGLVLVTLVPRQYPVLLLLLVSERLPPYRHPLRHLVEFTAFHVGVLLQEQGHLLSLEALPRGLWGHAV